MRQHHDERQKAEPVSVADLIADRRDLVIAEGLEWRKFFHAMCSQDFGSITEGESRWSFLLTPQGKVIAHFRATCISDRLICDLPAGFGEALRSSLARYLMRTKCQLATVLDVVRVGFENSSLTPGIDHGSLWLSAADLIEGDVATSNRYCVSAHPLLGSQPEMLIEKASLKQTTSVRGFETARLAAGLGELGAELNESTVPNSTGLVTWAVSFSKGCYVGQELVERIDSRSATIPSRLVVVEKSPSAATTDGGVGERESALRICTTALTSAAVRNGIETEKATGIEKELAPSEAGSERLVGLAWAHRAIPVGDVVDGWLLVAEAGDLAARAVAANERKVTRTKLSFK